MSALVEVRRLLQSDRLGLFDCGNPRLNEFLQKYAKQAEHRGRSATHLAIHKEVVVGFVTLVPGSTDPDPLRAVVKGLPKHPTPVLVLARMGTHKPAPTDEGTASKLRIGESLLRDVVFPAALKLRSDFGCVGILTDAKGESVGFYARYGFTSLLVAPANSDAGVPGEPAATTPMFLPVSTLVEAAR